MWVILLSVNQLTTNFGLKVSKYECNITIIINLEKITIYVGCNYFIKEMNYYRYAME